MLVGTLQCVGTCSVSFGVNWWVRTLQRGTMRQHDRRWQLCAGFHIFILAQLPMGAPVEWNIFSIQAALVLFGTISLRTSSCSD